LSAFRVCDAVDINLDLRTGYVNDRFDGEEGGRYGEVFSLLPFVVPISSNLVASVALRLLPVSFLLSMTSVTTRELSMRPRLRMSVS